MNHMFSIIFTICFLCSNQAYATGAVTIPKTGQTKSYYAGDDGVLQKGETWPVPRFFDNGDQTVSDKLTNLTWTKDANTPGPQTCTPATSKNWQGALDHVKCLNSNSYLGKKDWRLPNIVELTSLVNYGETNPATWLNMQGFYNVKTDVGYLSSSTIAVVGIDYAWAVDMGSGIVGGADKSYDEKTCIWPVRGGLSSLPTLNLTASPPAISFGNIEIATTSAPQAVTVTNSGASTTILGTTTVGGSNASDFTVVSDNCSGQALPAAATCQISMHFTPKAVGSESATLTINDSTQKSAANVALSGTGQNLWSITATVAGGNGTVSCTSPVSNGATATCTVTPANSYQLATFTDNNIDKKGAVVNSIYSMTAVTADHLINATFSLIPPPPVNGICGSSNGQTQTTAPAINLCSTGTPSPITGSGPWYWSCAGINGGTTASCMTNIAKSSYTVKAAVSGIGGTISPASKTVKAGATTTFTVKPNYGYSVAVTGCGGTLAGATYTTGAVSSDCTVTATFSGGAPAVITITTTPSAPTSYSGKAGIIAFTVTGTTTAQDLAKEVSTSDTWITPGTLTYSKGKGTVKYTVAANPSKNARQGSITIGGQSYAISQTGKPGKLTVTTSSTTPIIATGSSISIAVTIDPTDGGWSVSGIKWTPTTSADWLHGFISGATQTGNGTLNLTADANNTGKPRSAVLTFKSSDGKSTKSVTVKQAK